MFYLQFLRTSINTIDFKTLSSHAKSLTKTKLKQDFVPLSHFLFNLIIWGIYTLKVLPFSHCTRCTLNPT